MENRKGHHDTRQEKKGKRATHPPNVLFDGSGSTSDNTFMKEAPKSRSVIWSKGLPEKTLLKMSSVHFSSAADTVVCHWWRDHIAEMLLGGRSERQCGVRYAYMTVHEQQAMTERVWVGYARGRAG